MNTTTHTEYFQDLNGRICCTNHIGLEAKERLERQPNAKKISTSMTKWERITEMEIAEIATWNADICETCHFTK